MLKRLTLNGFTVFKEAEIELSPGINLVIGENGFGKSHLLKLGYCAAWYCDAMAARSALPPDRAYRARLLGEKLVHVFRPDQLGRLASRGQGRSRAVVDVRFDRAGRDFKFSFATNSKADVSLDKDMKTPASMPTVFLPTKEVVSMYPGFTALYRDYHLEIDETYYDLCLALERPLLRGPRETKMRPLLEPLEQILRGKVVNQNGRFILRQPGRGNMEMPLVAEGFRKLATVAFLIANGTLGKSTILFWDEPETNLNARYIREVAQTLVAVAGMGAQVIAATHSLFLMRELELLLQRKDNAKVARHFIALGGTPGKVEVSQGQEVSDIRPIRALDEELDQADRYLANEEA